MALFSDKVPGSEKNILASKMVTFPPPLSPSRSLLLHPSQRLPPSLVTSWVFVQNSFSTFSENPTSSWPKKSGGSYLSMRISGGAFKTLLRSMTLVNAPSLLQPNSTELSQGKKTHGRSWYESLLNIKNYFLCFPRKI